MKTNLSKRTVKRLEKFLLYNLFITDNQLKAKLKKKFGFSMVDAKTERGQTHIMITNRNPYTGEFILYEYFVTATRMDF